MIAPSFSPSAAERISDAAPGSVAGGRMPAYLRGSRELTVGEIARLTRSTVRSGGPAERRIRNFAALEDAGAADLAFFDNERDLGGLAATGAGACIMPPAFAAAAPSGLVVLLNEEPYRAFVAAAQALFAGSLQPRSLFEAGGRAAGAHVHASARIEAGVTIDPLAIIGPRAEIGAGTLIAAGAAVGPDVCVGRRCAIGAGATILHAMIGDGVVIRPGARIGQEGLHHPPDGPGRRNFPQVRRVIIQDGCEIGANATLDCGSIRDTVLGEGSKIDNLAQIADSVRIGRHCLVGAQACLGGNASVGDFVMIGRQVGVAEDVVIGDRAMLAAGSRVRTDIASGAHFGETPDEACR
jgi:UDP-3-O-[3-hydroxymyristoyl] glucosamine N-acyltransferase